MSRKRILSVIICVLLTSCDYPPKLEEENLGEIHIHLDHYKQANQSSSGVEDCYRVTEFFDAWEDYCEFLDGFEYEWGYEYELKVYAFKASDTPYVVYFTRRFYFREIINKQRVPVGTPFEYLVVNQDISKDDASGIYQFDINYYSNFKFTCEEQDCLYIESQNKNKIGMLIEFLHPQTSSEPFVFNQIKCSAPIDTFEEACNSF